MRFSTFLMFFFFLGVSYASDEWGPPASPSLSTHSASSLATQSGSDLTLLERRPRESEEERPLLDDGQQQHNPLAQSLQTALNQHVFGFENSSPCSSISRKTGYLLGAAAISATTAMILYATLDLVGVESTGWQDWTIIAITLAYLLPPTAANMAMISQQVTKKFFPPAQIPQEYDIRKHPDSHEEGNYYLDYPAFLKGFNHLLAMSNAFILPTVFYQIETDQDFDWSVWSFIVPYTATMYSMKYAFGQFGQKEHTKSLRQQNEARDAHAKRKSLQDRFQSFKKTLRGLDLGTINTIYDDLNGDQSGFAKLQEIMQSPISLTPSAGNSPLPSLEPEDGNNYLATYLPHYLVNPLSSIPQFFFFQYGLKRGLENFGVASLTASNASYGLAGFLTLLSCIIEGPAIKYYYEQVILQGFRNTVSESNPGVRRVMSLHSFLTGGVLALAEVYPAWDKTLKSWQPSYLAYGALTLMLLRHHASNGFWLDMGWNEVVSTLQRDDKEKKIDDISRCIDNLSEFLDCLNGAGIDVFNRQVKNFTDASLNSPVENGGGYTSSENSPR